MDPNKEWQRLTAHYAGMGDEELLELSEAYQSLTEVAQGVLRDELRNRKLPPPGENASGEKQDAAEKLRRLQALSNSAGDEDGVEDANAGREYTWKVTLREFASAEEAWMANEALKEAGIESWLHVPRNAMDPTIPRVQVGADDLERAAEVLAKPIPEEIRSAATAEVEDFAPPECPRCHDADPLLESCDPVNQWSCEACGHIWREEVVASE